MKNELSRALTHRHVQMIAIGGAIGTGLFLRGLGARSKKRVRADHSRLPDRRDLLLFNDACDR